jgi:protein-S-isoprenylcysteine O-methyltransferase Ste14
LPLSAAAQVTLACWALFEVVLRVREVVQGKGGRAHDRATRAFIGLSIGVTIVVAVWARAALPSLRAPGAVRVLGIVVMWAGLAVRAWAVATLGGAFRTTVEVDADQAVVTSGPYRWIRHPSYTGLLLVLAGFGLALGNWLSLAACLVLPLPAIVRRIRVEEAELDRVLGDAYRSYRTTTARLIPRLW